MQYQLHIHGQMERIFWPRCSTVEVKGDLFLCQLAWDREYDLVEAYAQDPHVEFLNCRTPDDLQAFVRAWGPMYYTSQEKRDGLAVRRIPEYIADLRWLQALQGMIEACKGRIDWRAALQEFVRAESSPDLTIKTDLTLLWLRQQFRVTKDFSEWIGAESLEVVQRAVIRCVELNVSGPSGGLKVERTARGFELKPVFLLSGLWAALNWMLLLDEWEGRPPRLCPECHKIFRPPTAHEKKYCSPECAHRATNRKWRKKDLRQRKRKARQRL